MGAATGGGGGRGAKGRKRGLSKTELRRFKFVKLGEGTYRTCMDALIITICSRHLSGY